MVVIRDVPADICDDCGEYYLSEPIARRVYADADGTVQRQVEVEIQRYAAWCSLGYTVKNFLDKNVH